jgi:hypothetical protein
MPNYAYPLSGVLAEVTREVQATITDLDNKGEWFCVKSRIHTDDDIFSRLDRRWRVITGNNGNRFALLLVSGGPDKGVWIHYFITEKTAAEYAPGSHRLASWA